MNIASDGSTLVLAGNFDARSTFEVRSALYDHMEGHRDDDVVVDLSEVEMVDVTALRVLAFASRQAHQSGQHLRLRGCRPSVRRLLHISRLARVVEVERAAPAV